ncbi:UDP-glucose 6-dehydrogenase [bacterium HR32]|nr:UDP-glucose 6-dehydrogenase [bacterium HR32]
MRVAEAVAVVGLRGVGLVVASCLAGPQRRVLALEVDRARYLALREGRLPFFEPGLEARFREAMGCGWLEVTSDPASLKANLVCVGAHPDEVPELADVLAFAEPGLVVALQAPVPLATADRLRRQILELRGPEFSFGVVSNPLVLRRGFAVPDFLRPRAVVLGGEPRWAVDRVADLYRGSSALVLRTDLRTAESCGWTGVALPSAVADLVERVRRHCGEDVDFDVVLRASLGGLADLARTRHLQGPAWGFPAAAPEPDRSCSGQTPASVGLAAP